MTGNVELRVKKGNLAEHSPVSKDMFSLPQPPPSTSSQPHSSRVQRYPFTAETPTISAIRLGLKYQMSALINLSVNYLKRYFSDKFEVWSNNDSYVPPSFDATHVIGVVNLARLIGELHMLPTAILACCAGGSDIFHGFLREDGSREQLTIDDLALCFSAQGRLIQESIRIVPQVLASPVPTTCLISPTWRRQLQKAFQTLGDETEQPAQADLFVPIEWIISLDDAGIAGQ
ncbi:hypothetical protein BD414DRAFT_535346 [Trametes punicea]|nr:hypothetical protein BD414DRAFT_535346 [Trametes punicea]